MANIGDIWYRYEDVVIRNSDDFGFTAGPPKVQVVLRKLRITRLTPKGVVVQVGKKEKRIRSESPKRYAHPTPIQALEGFIARKQSQMITLAAQHARAKQALAIGKAELNKAMFGG
jgi:hypothetical protein